MVQVQSVGVSIRPKLDLPWKRQPAGEGAAPGLTAIRRRWTIASVVPEFGNVQVPEGLAPDGSLAYCR